MNDPTRLSQSAHLDPWLKEGLRHAKKAHQMPLPSPSIQAALLAQLQTQIALTELPQAHAKSASPWFKSKAFLGCASILLASIAGFAFFASTPKASEPKGAHLSPEEERLGSTEMNESVRMLHPVDTSSNASDPSAFAKPSALLKEKRQESTEDRLNAETLGVLEIKRLLSQGDAQGALVKIRSENSKFPEGALTQEREFLSIKALQASGQSAEKEISRFKREHKSSTLSEKLP